MKTFIIIVLSGITLFSCNTNNEKENPPNVVTPSNEVLEPNIIEKTTQDLPSNEIDKLVNAYKTNDYIIITVFGRDLTSTKTVLLNRKNEPYSISATGKTYEFGVLADVIDTLINEKLKKGYICIKKNRPTTFTKWENMSNVPSMDYRFKKDNYIFSIKTNPVGKSDEIEYVLTNEDINRTESKQKNVSF
jgi:hypothetical protein